jgi:hypothetical protein
MTRWFEHDDELAAELADALRDTSDLTERIAARGKAVFTWRTIDEELLMAELTFDSAHELQPSSTRADTDIGRVLVFAADLRSVEVEVLSDRLAGQFVPPSSGRVDVEGDRGVVVATADVDDLGFFLIEPVPGGVVRLRCTTATTGLVTDWVRL